MMDPNDFDDDFTSSAHFWFLLKSLDIYRLWINEMIESNLVHSWPPQADL